MTPEEEKADVGRARALISELNDIFRNLAQGGVDVKLDYDTISRHQVSNHIQVGQVKLTADFARRL